jgi:hypothetical protein
VKLLFGTIGAALLVTIPATVGLVGNTSFSRTVPVRVPAGATVVQSSDDHPDTDPTTPAPKTAVPKKAPQLSDDHGGLRGSSATDSGRNRGPQESGHSGAQQGAHNSGRGGQTTAQPSGHKGPTTAQPSGHGSPTTDQNHQVSNRQAGPPVPSAGAAAPAGSGAGTSKVGGGGLGKGDNGGISRESGGTGGSNGGTGHG